VSSNEVPEAREMDLEEFLRILPHLEAAELMAICAAYQNGDDEAREAARNAASAVAKKRRLGDELGHLQGSIIQWATSQISPSSLFTFEHVGPQDRMLGDLRVQAVPPLLDAATALLVGRWLEADVRDALLEPWSSSIS
jgi:hypothetical protein